MQVLTHQVCGCQGLLQQAGILEKLHIAAAIKLCLRLLGAIRRKRQKFVLKTLHASEGAIQFERRSPEIVIKVDSTAEE